MTRRKAARAQGPPEDEARVFLAVPGLDELQMPLDELLAGGRLRFEVDGQRLYIRQPTPAERDESLLIRAIEHERLLRRADLAELAKEPLQPERLAALDAEIDALLTALGRQEETGKQRWIRTSLIELVTAKKQTAADPIADYYATLARDRWLAQRLLEDEAGAHLVTSPEVWAALPPAVQDTATIKTAEVMRLIYKLPFLRATASAPTSS